MRPYKTFAAKTVISAKKIAVFLTVSLLLGCSAARLGYSNGETISYWWLNNYVDFESDQTPWVKQRIAHLFAWHRKTQLHDYVKVLGLAQQRVHGKVSEHELLADYADLKRRILVITDKALPDLADLALSLKPEQIAHIEKKFASNNNDYRKDYLRGDVEKRQHFRFKKVLKQAEYWLGTFNSEQERLIRVASDARPLNNELVMADRLQRQAALIALLKKIQAEKPGRETTVAMLKKYVSATLDRFGDPEHNHFFDTSVAASARMTAVIINNATPAQKEHFVRTLQQWINDFNKLSA
jgi:hypothetical protein